MRPQFIAIGFVIVILAAGGGIFLVMQQRAPLPVALPLPPPVVAPAPPEGPLPSPLPSRPPSPLLPVIPPPSPRAAELEHEVRIGNTSDALRFVYADHELKLKEVTRGSKNVAVATPSIWQIVLREPDGTKTAISASGIQVPIRLATTESGERITNIFSWDPVAILPGKMLSAVVTIDYVKSTKQFEWRIAFDLPQGYSIYTIRFPSLTLLPIGSAANDIFTAPLYTGTLVKDPHHSIPVENVFSNPGIFSMQFFSFYDADAKYGLYLATADPEGSRKDYRTKSLGNGFEWEPMHYAPIPTPSHYELPYPVVLSFLEGDWYTGAQIYRSWAQKQPMFARGPWADAPTVSSKIKTADAMVLMSPEEQFNDHDQLADEAIAASNLLNTKQLLVYWYRWHEHVFDSDWPDIKPKSTFIPAAQKVTAQGMTVLPYFLPGQWETALPTYTQAVKNAACADENSVPHVNVQPFANNTSQASNFVRLDPSLTFSRTQEKSVINTFVNTFGVGGIYYDFWSGLPPEICFNTVGRPQNGGPSWEQGKKELARQARDYSRNLKPNFVITSESLDENLIPVLDMMHGDSIGAPYAPPNILPVPLWPAVYHDAILISTFGGINAIPNAQNDTSRIYATVPYMYGQLVSFTNWFANAQPFFNTNPAAGSPLGLTRQFAKNLVDAYAYTRPYILEGKMLHPLPGTFFDTFNYNPSELAKPFSSVWRAENGRVGVVVVNPLTTVSTFHATLNFSAYGLSSSVTVYRRVTNGARVNLGTAQNAYSMDLSVPPLSVAFYEFVP